MYQNPAFPPDPPELTKEAASDSVTSVGIVGRNLYSPNASSEQNKKCCSADRIFGVAFVATLAVAALVAICVVLIFRLPQAQGSESSTRSDDIDTLRQELETLKQLVNNHQEVFSSDGLVMKSELNSLMQLQDTWQRMNNTVGSLQLKLHTTTQDFQNTIDDGMSEVSRANDAFQLALDDLRTNLSDSFQSTTTMIDQVSLKASQEAQQIDLQLNNFTEYLKFDVVQLSAKVDDLSDSVNLEMDEIRSNYSEGKSHTWPVLIDSRL